jgi:hypothetical protein
VPISGKRVFGKWVLPKKGHQTECFGPKTRKSLCNSADFRQTCFLGMSFAKIGTSDGMFSPKHLRWCAQNRQTCFLGMSFPEIGTSDRMFSPKHLRWCAQNGQTCFREMSFPEIRT